ncbi:keratin-associated protein 5-4-like isoform X2 [Cylas formicarius]|uniref:keratin-associated protein 5-4-like isoform X2 n=1 Tax=Cylas formicarius TaxID=197179 RepID=UPI0029583FB9|nr:keratin-associated protein 5-4-like isoform X2 [Cylas formicarius]
MSCARCGCGIYKTEEFISLNKVWHKCCFTCHQCNKRLDKSTAKIFQGELFCEICYSCVIEKLFEVISAPSLKKPTRVVSSPSCASKSFDKRLEECGNLLKNFNPTKNEGAVRAAQSCICIPSRQEATKNDYCLVFPIPREVANYYNRSHMRDKARKASGRCCPPNETQCSCRPRSPPPCDCSAAPRPIQLRSLTADSENCRSCRPCCPARPQSSPPLCPAYACPPLRPSAGCPRCCPVLESGRPRAQCCEGGSPTRRCKCGPKRACAGGATAERRACTCAKPKRCACDSPKPCDCKMAQVRAACTSCCIRCKRKVYAAEKVLVSCGAFHTSCFSCFCCNKLLDVKNVFEGCGEIYCKQCYNHFFGIQYYGFGRLAS